MVSKMPTILRSRMEIFCSEDIDSIPFLFAAESTGSNIATRRTKGKIKKIMKPTDTRFCFIKSRNRKISPMVISIPNQYRGTL